MGTNYYLTDKELVCSACKRQHDKLHIGKDSAGWAFALRVYPKYYILGIKDWLEIWKNENSVIIDDQGNIIDKEFLKNRIISKVPPASSIVYTKEFLTKNYAVFDKKINLLRCDPVTHLACATHGNGTYDLLEKDFC
jgi:hypothetical protein